MNQIEQWKKQGYIIENGKILAAAPQRIKNFSAPCAPGKLFQCEHDKDGKVIKKHYRPVTQKEATALKNIIDPVTKKPYLSFAMVPVPKELLTGISAKELVEELDASEITPKGLKKNKAVDGIKIDVIDQDLNGDAEVTGSFVAPTGGAPQGTQGAQGSEDGDDSKDAEGGEGEGSSETGSEEGEEDNFDKLEEEQEKKASSGDIEKAELSKKNKDELKKIAKDELGLELSGKETKEQLIEMILG